MPKMPKRIKKLPNKSKPKPKPKAGVSWAGKRGK